MVTVDADPAYLQTQIQALYDLPVVARAATATMGAQPAALTELASLGPAAPRRVKEFAAGRACARAAVTALTGSASPILRRGRIPIWPPGVVGSISHCPGACAAVVGDARHIAAIGLDVERDEPLAQPTLRAICRPDELQMYAAHSHRPALSWGKIAFSAKEALYKCYAPVFEVFLDFQDVRLTLTETAPGIGLIQADLVNHTKPGDAFITALRGRWCLASGLVLSGAWVSKFP